MPPSTSSSVASTSRRSSIRKTGAMEPGSVQRPSPQPRAPPSSSPGSSPPRRSRTTTGTTSKPPRRRHQCPTCPYSTLRNSALAQHICPVLFKKLLEDVEMLKEDMKKRNKADEDDTRKEKSTKKKPRNGQTKKTTAPRMNKKKWSSFRGETVIFWLKCDHEQTDYQSSAVINPTFDRFLRLKICQMQSESCQKMWKSAFCLEWQLETDS